MRLGWIFFLPLAGLCAQPRSVESAAWTGFNAIRSDDLRTYLTYLSSDALQGRETSYPGEKLAASYIAAHFRSFGLTPAGDSGTFLQHFEVELVHENAGSSIVLESTSGKQSFYWGQDFMSLALRDTVLKGPIAFIGYHDNQAPEGERDKLAGRIVISFIGSRASAQDTSLAGSQRKFASSTRREPGALAALNILDDVGATSYWRVVGRFNPSEARMALPGEGFRQAAQPTVTYAVSPSLGSAIAALCGKSLAQLRIEAASDSIFRPILLDDASLTITSATVREHRQTENVAGLLEGSDPVMKKDVVVFSAHFDHLGVGPKGEIYHGADDDGSGTAMVMELAHAFAVNPVRPRCSVLFLTVSGEEKGLLGSAYYTRHPFIPLEQTVADFNTDMIGRIDPAHESSSAAVYTYLIGSDKISTQLDSILQVANSESNHIQFDYTYNSDLDPNRFYRRSDHFNFARHGVPIAFFFTGVHADYHQPTDTVDKILFSRMVTIGQVIYYAGWKTANLTHLLEKNGTGSGYTDPPPQRSLR